MCEPLKFREVIALITSNIFDVDISGELLNRVDIRSFIGIAAGGYRTIKIGAWHAGERNKPLAFLFESAGSKYRDRRRIR